MLVVQIKKTLPGFCLDVSFSVNGEILGVLGQSGSGKTMTLHCIAGLIQPDEGFIELDGRVLFDSSRKVNLSPMSRKVGLVFQNYALFPHLSARENIAYGIRNLPQNEIDNRVNTLFDKMGLDGLQHRYPRQLSAGQQQRVAVARALAPDPEALLLDEPFSALDSLTKEQLEMEITHLQQFYRGHIILVTHDLSEAYRLSTKLAVYKAGRVVQCDLKEKVISAPDSQEVARITRLRNFINGTVVEIKGSDVLVAVSGLEANLMVTANSKRRLTINQPVTVGVRPEYITTAEGTGQNTFQGTLYSFVETISSINCYFHMQTNNGRSHSLEAVFPKSGLQTFAKGQNYYLHLPPEHLVLIPN